MNNKAYMLFKQVLLFFVTFLICIFSIITDENLNSLVLTFLHITIVFICVFSLFLIDIERTYSLFKIFHVFSLFFFGISPILQYNARIIFWDGPRLSESDYIITSSLIIFILLTFNFLYLFFKRIKIPFFISSHYYKLSLPDSKNMVVNKRGCLLLLLLSCSIFLFIFKENDFNIIKMFFRGVLEDNLPSDSSDSKVSGLLTNNFIRPVSVIIFLFSYYYGLRIRWVLVCLFLFMLITIFPTGIPRFMAAALYIPIAIFTIPFIRKKNVFILSIIIGLLLVFPFLNLFRWYGSSDSIDFKLNFDMFKEGHFDSYQSFAQVISNNIITYGNQLLGSFFFFIPRLIWPTKPIGSGAELANELNYSFSNVSCNYFAEGYINFGLLGVLVFIVILAYFTSLMDKIYWDKIKFESKNFFTIIYLLSLGLLFFLLRGDLMSSIAFSVAIIFSAFCVFKLFRHFIN